MSSCFSAFYLKGQIKLTGSRQISSFPARTSPQEVRNSWTAALVALWFGFNHQSAGSSPSDDADNTQQSADKLEGQAWAILQHAVLLNRY